MKIIGVIPARYKSSRFEGKPLANILGKPMIWWTYENAKKAKGLDELVVATDHNLIYETCKQYNIDCIFTSDKHSTGVDRLSEVSKKLKGDFYILIQGDEPLLETQLIDDMVHIIKESAEKDCVYTYKTEIKNPVDAVNNSIIKIVTNMENYVLFASRSAIPYPKAGLDFKYFKSVGIYAYPYSILDKFPEYRIGDLEKIEDHDFMRLLENRVAIKALEADTQTISVDTPKDLKRIIKILEGKIC